MPINLRHGGFEGSGVRERSLASLQSSPDFDYMFQSLVNDDNAHLPKSEHAADVVKNLRNLASVMVNDSDSTINNSTIPPIYTYWGQFIDHDITAGTDRLSKEQLKSGILQQPENFQPLSPEEAKIELINLAQPYLNLSSIYDKGPTEDSIGIYEPDGVLLALGTNYNLGDGLTPDRELGLERDIPRRYYPNDDETEPLSIPIIGDSRNDENLIISQFHVAMLKFHNAVVDWVEKYENKIGCELFKRAQQLSQWHFQWLVVNDYLKTIALDCVVNKTLYSDDYIFKEKEKVYMPLEFSVAAFRFGHSMIGANYDFNTNFGRVSNDLETENRASLSDLFKFTSRGRLLTELPVLDKRNIRLAALPNKWIIDWSRFTDKRSPFHDRFARKIDTNLVPALGELVHDLIDFQDKYGKIKKEETIRLIMNLAARNLLRGYLLSIPTGQAIARYLGLHELTSKELLQETSDDMKCLLEKGMLHKTPLWYYILKEAEVQTDGNRLGEVGSYIISHTLIGLLKADPDSYINREWTPSDGVKFRDDTEIVTIMDLLRFANVAV